MKKLFKVTLACLLVYGLLYWAVNNPNSASSVKATIDNTADSVVGKAKDIADNLTDEE